MKTFLEICRSVFIGLVVLAALFGIVAMLATFVTLRGIALTALGVVVLFFAGLIGDVVVFCARSPR